MTQDHKACPEEHFIAQRLLFYCSGDLIEFSVMLYSRMNLNIDVFPKIPEEK